VAFKRTRGTAAGRELFSLSLTNLRHLVDMVYASGLRQLTNYRSENPRVVKQVLLPVFCFAFFSIQFGSGFMCGLSTVTFEHFFPQHRSLHHRSLHRQYEVVIFYCIL
jgi:hypothetical protein